MKLFYEIEKAHLIDRYGSKFTDGAGDLGGKVAGKRVSLVFEDEIATSFTLNIVGQTSVSVRPITDLGLFYDNPDDIIAMAVEDLADAFSGRFCMVCKNKDCFKCELTHKDFPNRMSCDKWEEK